MSELNLSSELLQVSPEVQEALKHNKPIVALESTIISHGMPFPQNAQTAIEVEQTIRNHGAVPATIAIIGGVMKVGLSKEEIEVGIVCDPSILSCIIKPFISWLPPEYITHTWCTGSPVLPNIFRTVNITRYS